MPHLRPEFSAESFRRAKGNIFQIISIRKFNSHFFLQVPCKNKRIGKQLASQHILKVSVKTN